MKKIFRICLLSSLFAVSINAMESSRTELLNGETEQDVLMEARISDLEKQVQYLLAEKRMLESEVARLEIAPNKIFVFGAKGGRNIVPIEQFDPKVIQ